MRVGKQNRRARMFSGKRRRKRGSGWVKHRRNPPCMGYFYAQARLAKQRKRIKPEMYASVAEAFAAKQ